ncbi:hypothetical protein BH11ACT7_BH11ACT7_24680 [soil metagenome]
MLLNLNMFQQRNITRPYLGEIHLLDVCNTSKRK